jgi:hypothetical protein
MADKQKAPTLTGAQSNKRNHYSCVLDSDRGGAMNNNIPFYVPPGFYVDDTGVRSSRSGEWICPHPVRILHIATYHDIEKDELVRKKLIIHRDANATSGAFARLASDMLSRDFWQRIHETCPCFVPHPELLTEYLRGLVQEFIRREKEEEK